MIYFLSYPVIILLTSSLNIVSSPHSLPYFQKMPLPAQDNSEPQLLADSTTFPNIPKHLETSSLAESLSDTLKTTVEPQNATTLLPKSRHFSRVSVPTLRQTENNQHKKEKQVEKNLQVSKRSKRIAHKYGFPYSFRHSLINILLGCSFELFNHS